jgi:hypothetical protein
MEFGASDGPARAFLSLQKQTRSKVGDAPDAAKTNVIAIAPFFVLPFFL